MSTRLWKHVLTAAVSLTAVLWFTGCACMEATPQKTYSAPSPEPVQSGCPVVMRDGENLVVRQAFPTGNEETSVILLEKSAPAEVNAGQTFDFTVTARNLTDCRLDQVVVTDQMPEGFSLKRSSPQAQSAGGNTVKWNLGSIAGGQSKTVNAQGTVSSRGEYEQCLTVSYVENVCMTISAVEPALKLEKYAPSEVMICDPIPVRVVVTNTGTGNAENVTITDTLPAGLTAPDGGRRVTYDVGTLAAGQSREYTFNAKAGKTGSFENTARATAKGGLEDSAKTRTVVRQPVLEISKSGKDMIYQGRPVEYSIEVRNTGDAPARNLQVVDTIPAGSSFMSASSGGQFANGEVVWNLGTLAPTASKSLSVTVRAEAQGDITNRVTASAVCADAVSATASTRVEGIAAILLEVIDVSDPIEVGNNETYVITATNQGSAVDRNVQIVATLEEEQEFVSAEGATDATVRGKTITFKPLPALQPKAQAIWRVKVKALGEGDIRFSLELTSDMLKRPVRETESTHQY